VGGYSDWLRQRPSNVGKESFKREVFVKEKKKAKLSYKETRELEALPKEIAALEAEQLALSGKMHAQEYYRQPPEVLRDDQKRNAEIEKLLLEKLDRWEALDNSAGSPRPD